MVKINIVKNGYVGGYYRCPICGNEEIELGQNYCHICGVAIEWKED